MAFNTFPSKGGIPSGNTAGRPSNPTIGDTYYNGQQEALEIYNGTSWKIVRSEGFPPDAPTISSVTDSSTSLAYSSTAGTLDVVFVPAGTGGTPTQYNAYTTTGGHSGFTTVGSTVTITGLTPGTAYTVYGNSQNGSGTSTNTTNAAPVTPTTRPQAPTIGTTTLSSGLPVVNWTLNSNGGKNLTSITITPYLNGTTAETSRTAATTSSTSYTFTSGQVTNKAAYTFKVKVTNANGDSLESSASNSVTVDEPIPVEYLVVAGAGGGGQDVGGGGGAGGMLTGNTTVNSGTVYTVTVGAGGSGSTSNSVATTSGDNSSISGSGLSTITATGGGGGGNWSGPTGHLNGKNGGSGGGAGGYAQSATGGTGINGQGYAGGNNTSGVNGNSGGGGGGAGGVGANSTTVFPATSTHFVSGGAGVASSITGSSVTYAAGGRGSGDAATGTVSGGANTGNGGDGDGGAGGGPFNGGSGVVIIRATQAASATTGSPTVTTSGSYTIYKFTGNGSITY